jgi:hypothetical protein
VSRRIHLVGSIPLHDTAEVFETLGTVLGPWVDRLPDGETGERRHWMGWLEPIFAEHPAFEPTDEIMKVHAKSRAYRRYRLKPGHGDALRFDELPHADVFAGSYAEFRRQKQAGKVPESCRFQVSLANPISVAHTWIVEEEQDRVEPAYREALIEQIRRLATIVPPHELAIQWDMATPIFASLERGVATRYGADKTAMLERFATHAIEIGNAVPAGVDLLFHLCYGDSNHKHAEEPTDMSDMVRFANRVASGIARSIELFHMPVPRDRSDDAYFAPLKQLAIAPETMVCLGLVHHTDGVEGTRRRLATAERYIDRFVVATECGFGRRALDTIPELLHIHAEIAAS